MPIRVRRRKTAIAIGLLLIAGSVFGTAGPAFAHNFLVSSDPSAGQTLTRLPSRFTITTNEGLLDLSGHGAGFAMDVEDSHGRFYGDGCVSVTGPAMSITPSIGAAGRYKVIWQIVSADGHVVSNEYSFTWKPSGDFTPAAGFDHPQDCHGRSGGTAPPDPNLGRDTTASSANLGLVLGIGGGILGLGVVLTLVLLFAGRRRKPADPESRSDAAGPTPPGT